MNAAPTLTITSIFTLHDPADQAELFDLLTANCVSVLQESDGFHGSTLSRSDDGTTVVHHALWRDKTAAQNMLRSAGANDSMGRTRALADVHVVPATHNRQFVGTRP